MRNIRTIDLNLLVAFDALYDEGSVTRAAKRLALTQPTVSGILNRLRDQIDDPLFVRTSHGILPTPRATALAEPVKNLLAEAQALIAPESFDPATAEITVSLCGNDYVQYALITPFIEEVRRQAPRVRFSISPTPASQLYENLARGDVDLAITTPEFTDPNLPARPLYKDRYVCVGRKAHPMKAGRISLDQLCEYEHLLVSPASGSFSGPVDEALGELGRKRRVARSLPTFYILFDVLRGDNFIAFVPKRLLRERMTDLKIFQTPVSIPGLEIIASWHPRVSKDPRHIWLRDVLATVATGLNN